MLDIKYNYLIGSAEPLPSNYNIDDRPDPDTDGCKKLYDDIIEAYFKDMKNHTIENVKQQFKANKNIDSETKWRNYKSLNNENADSKDKDKNNQPPCYTIFIDKETQNQVLLSSDYFGPSVYWAIESGINDDQIRKFLDISRTIGGHIVWPRGRGIINKINVSRAGNNGIYDRPDWTLLLLKIYFEKRDEKSFLDEANNLIPEEFRRKENFNNKFKRLYSSFCDSNDWIDFVGSFEKFCEQFKLIGSFVDDNLSIKILSELFPVLPKNYEDYIENTCQAIKLRNNILKKSAKKHEKENPFSGK